MSPSTKNIVISVFAILIIGGVQSSHAVYTEPTRRMVLNEVIDFSQQKNTFPIYLSDAGRYFAEVYLTDANGEVNDSHQRPISLQVKVDFLRKGKLLRSETHTVEFAPGEVNKTLFTARAPNDLPQRRNIDVAVAVANMGDTPEDRLASNLRLQITRKFEFAPIFVR